MRLREGGYDDNYARRAEDARQIKGILLCTPHDSHLLFYFPPAYCNAKCISFFVLKVELLIGWGFVCLIAGPRCRRRFVCVVFVSEVSVDQMKRQSVYLRVFLAL